MATHPKGTNTSKAKLLAIWNLWNEQIVKVVSKTLATIWVSPTNCRPLALWPMLQDPAFNLTATTPMLLATCRHPLKNMPTQPSSPGLSNAPLKSCPCKRKLSTCKSNWPYLVFQKITLLPLPSLLIRPPKLIRQGSLRASILQQKLTGLKTNSPDSKLPKNKKLSSPLAQKLSKKCHQSTTKSSLRSPALCDHRPLYRQTLQRKWWNKPPKAQANQDTWESLTTCFRTMRLTTSWFKKPTDHLRSAPPTMFNLNLSQWCPQSGFKHRVYWLLRTNSETPNWKLRPVQFKLSSMRS